MNDCTVSLLVVGLLVVGLLVSLVGGGLNLLPGDEYIVS